ncbi:MAG TPA: hypothetical protein VGF98_04995 [Candidatus Tumulicola sp.]
MIRGGHAGDTDGSRTAKRKLPEFALVPLDYIANIPSLQSRVHIALLAFRNSKTGQCNPLTSDLIDVCNTTEGHLERALRGLKRLEIIDWNIVRTGPRSSARRHFRFKDYPSKKSGSEEADYLPNERGNPDDYPSDLVATTPPICSGAYKVIPNRELVTENVDDEKDSKMTEELRQAITALTDWGLMPSQVKRSLEAGRASQILAWADAIKTIDWTQGRYRSVRSPRGFVDTQIAEGQMPDVPVVSVPGETGYDRRQREARDLFQDEAAPALSSELLVSTMPRPKPTWRDAASENVQRVIDRLVADEACAKYVDENWCCANSLWVDQFFRGFTVTEDRAFEVIRFDLLRGKTDVRQTYQCRKARFEELRLQGVA